MAPESPHKQDQHLARLHTRRLSPTPSFSGDGRRACRRATPCPEREGRSSIERRGAMSHNNGKGPRLELKLDLSLATRGGTSARVAAEGDSPNGSLSSSPPSSCLSSCSNSPEATSMVLAGCPRCLMYVMLSEEDPKCPKCKSAVLLDFLHGSNTTTTTTTTTKSSGDNNNNNNGKSKTRKS